MWHWLWDCLGLLLPSCQNTFCSFLSCFTRTFSPSFQCFFFSHIITTSKILSPCLALVGQDRGERSADRGLFMLRLWLSSQSICLTGQEVSDCCRSFLSTESVTCPLAEVEKPANTQWPMRLWMQGCLPWSQVVYFAWRSHRFKQYQWRHRAATPNHSNTGVRWWHWKLNWQTRTKECSSTLGWL